MERPGHPANANDILVVDDEESIRKFFGRLFEPPQYSLIRAADGMSALNLAEARHIDLAFVDVKMPGIDGIETCKGLKKIQPGIKLVLMSGHLSDETAEAQVEAGAEIFLAKPFPVPAVLEIAERLLQSR